MLETDFTIEFFVSVHKNLETAARKLNPESWRDLVHDQFCKFAKREVDATRPPEKPCIQNEMQVSESFQAWLMKYVSWRDAWVDSLTSFSKWQDMVASERIAAPPRYEKNPSDSVGDNKADERFTIWARQHELWCKQWRIWTTFVAMSEKRRIAYVKTCMKYAHIESSKRNARCTTNQNLQNFTQESSSTFVDDQIALKIDLDELESDERLCITIFLECGGLVKRWWLENRPNRSYYKTLQAFKRGKSQLMRRFHIAYSLENVETPNNP